MKKILLIPAVLLFLLCSCSVGFRPETPAGETSRVTEAETTIEPDPVETLLSSMTTEEKVGQLFTVTPEALEGVCSEALLNGSTGEAVTEFTDALASAIEKYHPGGVVLFYQNILNEAQIREFTAALHNAGKVPLLLAVDEEGGRVARIANNESFSVPRYESMEAVGGTGDPQKAYDAAFSIGSYLREYGFDLDLAPVADINSNPLNRVIGDRSFGSDPSAVTAMVTAAQRGFRDAGVLSCLKHFPGHGDTAGDTHEGFVRVDKTWDELLSNEIVPFKTAIDDGAQFVMAAHLACPAVTGDELPATLSYTMITEKLRGELGFRGVVMTDGMNMGAITESFPSGEAAVRAIEAGCDIILGPYDFEAAYNAVLEAVNSGRLTTERLDGSVRRILNVKMHYTDETVFG